MWPTMIFFLPLLSGWRSRPICLYCAQQEEGRQWRQRVTQAAGKNREGTSRRRGRLGTKSGSFNKHCSTPRQKKIDDIVSWSVAIRGFAVSVAMTIIRTFTARTILQICPLISHRYSLPYSHNAVTSRLKNMLVQLVCAKLNGGELNLAKTCQSYSPTNIRALKPTSLDYWF